MKEETELSKAVRVLKTTLKEDPELYFGYQSNIAMAFYDEYNQSGDKSDIHKISNNAAKRFLDLFTIEYEEA